MHDSPPLSSRDQAGRRATIMTVLAGLSVVIAMAIWLYRQQNQQAIQTVMLNPQAVAQPPAGDRLIGENPAGDGLGLMAGPKSLSQLMMTSSQDRLLLEEPANLPTYPGAQRQAGLRRLCGGIVEETVFWHHAKVSPTDLQSFYAQAILRAGFHPHWLRSSPEAADIQELYVRPPGTTPTAGGNDQVLMLRSWRSPNGGTHWMLWLRYPQVQ